MIQFRNIPIHLQSSFTKIYTAYTALNGITVVVRRKELRASTMRAQPYLISKMPWNLKVGYRIDVGYTVRSTDIKVDSLPVEVLSGWFAHELGHVEDYSHRSILGNIWLGLNYLFRKNYAKKVEWEADRNAVRAGFYPTIKATKEYLAGIDDGEKGYRRKLSNLYMSLDELDMCNLELTGRVEQVAE